MIYTQVNLLWHYRSLKRNNKKGELNQTEETTNLKLTEGVRFNIRLSIVFYFVLFSPRPWARKPYVPPMPGRGQDAVIAVLLRCVLEAGSPRTRLPDAQRGAGWGLKPSIFFQSETELAFGVSQQLLQLAASPHPPSFFPENLAFFCPPSVVKTIVQIFSCFVKFALVTRWVV